MNHTSIVANVRSPVKNKTWVYWNVPGRVVELTKTAPTSALVHPGSAPRPRARIADLAPERTATSLETAEASINAVSGGGWNGEVLLSQSGIQDGTPEVVSNHLGSAGMRARKTGDLARAKLLWSASLAAQPTNLRTASVLGQALYFERNYCELEYLERAEGMANLALLYTAWANLELGRENDDDQQLDEGLDRTEWALQE